MAQSMSMARTMDDLKAPAPTWGSEVRNYEHEKRRVVDADLVRGQQLRLKPGTFAAQERIFDPLLQRYRDNNIEATQRLGEERERVAHLNRAQDIQILREQPFHIVNHESKLDKLAPGADPMRLGGHGTLGENPRSRHGRGNFPTTAVDYNIVSNLPQRDQYWSRPDERPHLKERKPKERKVPHFLVKDFDIVTNKYTEKHEEKLQRDRTVALLEATHKHMTRNAYDPVVQQFADPRAEETAKVIDHAREVEIVLRAEALKPPSYKGRQTAFYGMLSHEVHDPDVIRVWDTMEDERRDRFRNRYIVEHNLHAQDVKGDHINQVRQLNRVAPERYEEAKRRGYDIIDNKVFGPGAKEKPFNEPFPKKRLTPWEKIAEGQTTDGPYTPGERHHREPSSSSRSMRPEEVSTIRLPPDAQGKRLESSSSAHQLRSNASVRSGVSSTRSRSTAAMRHSQSAGALRGYAPPRGLAATPFAPPPAPVIPGSPMGSVYSRPRG